MIIFIPENIKDKIVYNLSEQINNITIIWNRIITKCNSMFLYLSNITYIDLSNFNTSQVTSMPSMFYGCSSLILLNLNNLNTSQFTSMSCIFAGCKSLTS